MNIKIKNRGATNNPTGRFETFHREALADDWNEIIEEETVPTLETVILLDHAKTVISRNNSPDIPFEQSVNPYRGCEHGCIYCYARPSHAYINLSPGLDFESKIFYKANAAKLLEKELSKQNYLCKPIMLGANTDPYQPIESKLKVTQSILQLLNQYNHPVVITTKGSLIERDIDLLAEMAKRNLVKVGFSVTTLSNDLKLKLEPRTSTARARLKAIHKLSNAGIPVRVMASPMIPMINDMELEHILKLASEVGATHASYITIRLPYEVKDLFKDWLTMHFPERAAHVMSIIKQMHGGKEYDAQFGKRMQGEGQFAELLATRFTLACKRFGLNQTASLSLDTKHFKIKPNPKQMELF